MTIELSPALVSVITPCFNSEGSIRKTIESVMAQTYTNWEMLIVDDCSSDQTQAVVEEYASRDPRIKFIPRRWNAGAAVTRNRAISEARGRFIAFLDSDDAWHPQKLAKQLEFMETTGTPLSYTAYSRVTPQGVSLGNIMPPATLSYRQLLGLNQIGCLTAIYDAEKLGKVYMPNIRKRQDFALWLKILKQIDKAHGMQEVLAEYTVAPNSLSGNKLNAAKFQWRVYREVENLPFSKAFYHFGRYAWNGVGNRLVNKVSLRRARESSGR